MKRPLTDRARDMLRGEAGGITAFALLILVACLMMGGLAVDYANAIAARSRLQVTADAVAHAALYSRELKSADEARQIALQIAAENMPPSRYGTVLTADDIRFGRWDETKRKFIEDPAARDAVLVTTRQAESNGNGVPVLLLKLAGLNAWNVTTQSVYTTYYPSCFREGFVAMDRVDMQSNGTFKAGFCIHSQSYVSVSSNNTFEPGVVVSMPDKRNIDLPASGFKSNTGLAQALRDGSYAPRILNRIDDIFMGAEEPFDYGVGYMIAGSPYYRDYLDSGNIVTVNYKKGITAGTIQEGRIHRATCPNPKTHMTIESDAVIRKAVLITNCRLQIKAGAVIEDAVILVDNTDAKSVFASSDITLGRDDGCAEGGDVQLVTRGGVEFASKVNIYGSQILAAGDVSMTANADGIEGASIVAGGKLDVTSNGAFGFCNGAGMNNNFEAAYFRMAG